MSVKIRLSFVGKKHAPICRIMVADSRSKRDGKFIENIGTYNPLKHDLIRFNEDRLNYWVSQGAIPSDSVKKIYKNFKNQKPLSS